MRTVAEGVERWGQLHELRSWRCDLVQGHLLARPAEAGHDDRAGAGRAAAAAPDLLERVAGQA